MSVPNDVTNASLVLLGLPDTQCFASMQEFLQALPSLLGVAIPPGITNVIVSNEQPSDSQTTSVWFRLSNSGSFLSINVFSNGLWHPIYPVNTTENIQIFWFYSLDGTAPAGWLLIDDGDTDLPAAVVTWLKTMYLFDPTNAFYVYASYRFIGF